MQIDIVESASSDPAIAVSELCAQIGDGTADFAFVCADADLDAAALAAAGRSLPVTFLHGVTSCMGPMTARSADPGQRATLAAFVIRDPEGDYGTGCQDLGDDPRQAAVRATLSALAGAGRSGEVPDVVWLTATPGTEEQLIQGIQDVVGDGVPIIGGSAADNDMSGRWYVFSAGGSSAEGVTVSVLFPSTQVAFSFSNGLVPTAHRGTVTKARGRSLISIDDRPAGQVYAEWLADRVLPPGAADSCSMMPERFALAPLGRRVSDLRGVPNYLQVQPRVTEPNDSLTLYGEVAEGEQLTLMTGDPRLLADRAGRVAARAVPFGIGRDMIAGALMVYCGGCMLAARDRMDRIVNGTGAALGHAPFLGLFSFGEQGPVLGAGNRHGNLMISCLVFTRSVSGIIAPAA
ncbi:FIST signal transduction protein [Chachezhania sediminis]|uniref:FIST signal transduction protein n=1 Tax=Chachezhania sediminis TaxID=2599291 RepID=UPI00131E357C|nr:FIST N-terminal domain-containing protein [Chachezhania sediminis]